MAGKATGPPPPGFNVQTSESEDVSSHRSSQPSAPPAEQFTNSQGVHPVPTSIYPSTSGPYTEPPPSYQNAMTYPTAVPEPKPLTGYPPAPGYYPQQSPMPNITIHQQAPQPQRPVVVHVSTGAGAVCGHCGLGVLRKEPDVCCLVCLVLLTIFTFPFGLVFLCCLPCAVQQRCSNCGRST